MLCMRGTGVMMFVLSLPKLLSRDAWSTTSSSLSATRTCNAKPCDTRDGEQLCTGALSRLSCASNSIHTAFCTHTEDKNPLGLAHKHGFSQTNHNLNQTGLVTPPSASPSRVTSSFRGPWKSSWRVRSMLTAAISFRSGLIVYFSGLW